MRKHQVKTGSGDGSCVCGAVRFTVSFPSRFCSHCHCDNCRRAHSAAFVTYLGFKSAQVRVRAGRNALAEYAYSYKLKGKSITSRRRFCRKCGTQLFFESSRWPGEIHVPLAAIPRGADRAPQLHFYFDHRPAWMIPVNDRLPKYGGKTGGEKIRSASN